MKIYFQTSLWIVCIALSSMLFSSCEDFLDRQEDEKLTFEKIWESRNTTKQYWLTTMSYLPKFNSTFVGDNDPYLGASDECSIAYDRGYRYINFGSWNPSTIPYGDKTESYYKGIRECNIFMQNVDRCSDPLVTKTQLAQWKIQTRFARAYYYFLMMQDYGPVYLVGDELIDFTGSAESFYRPRNTWEECVNYVVSEMTACAEDNAMTDGWVNDSDMGLATKGTCQAVIARLLLYSARDLFNGNKLYKDVKNPVTNDFPELSGVNLFPQEYNANKWLEAAKAAKKLIDNPIYKLYRSKSNDPYENYYGITHETWNSELIWTDGYWGLYSWGCNTVPTSIGGTAYGSVGPTQQQVDAYAMSNGRYPINGYNQSGNPIIDPESGYPEDEYALTKWSYPAKGWSIHDNYDITAPNMYKNREPRFYVTVFFGGNTWLYGSAKTLTSFAKGGNGNKTHDYPKSGYLCNRFYDHKQNSAEGKWGNITFPVFRLAEMYLNFVEAVLECEKRNVSYPEKAEYKALAMKLWDDLRDRSGVPPIMEVYPGATIKELIQYCRNERRVEFAFERLRYFDTRTWMIAEQTDGGPMYGMDTTFPVGDDITATPEGFWNRTVFETRVFKSNHYLFPFAQKQLDRNKLLTQNFGW